MISQFLVPIFFAVCLMSLWNAACLPCRKGGKILFFLLCVLGLAYIIPLGPYFDPALHMPYPLVLLLALISAFAFFYFWFRVMHLSISIIFLIISIGNKNIRNTAQNLLRSGKLNLAEILLCTAAAALSVSSTLAVPEINRISLYYNNLPPQLEGYTIAQITDTHTGLIFRKNWQEGVVQKILAEQPDLIVHTGDIGDTKPQDIAEHLAPLQKLTAPDGVFFVFGNHENYHVLSHWQQYFKDSGLQVLENQRVRLPGGITLIGAKSQPRYQHIDFPALFGSAPNKSFTVLLDHYPLRFRSAAPFVDLQLSGHTHGGTVFFLAPIVAKFNGGFVSGVYEQNGTKLYVSSGTGIWTYTPFRLLVPSEIALITLHKKQ